MTNGNIWFNEDKTEFFWIPSDVELQRGGYRIRSLADSGQNVERQDLEPFKITKEKATEQAATFLNEKWGEMHEATGRLMDAIRGEDNDGKNPFPASLEGLLGLDPGRIITDPSAAKESAKIISERIKERIKKKKGKDDTKDSTPDKAKDDIDQEQLAQDIDNRMPDFGALGDQIREHFQSDEMRQSLHKLGTDLSGLAEKLQGASEQLRAANDKTDDSTTEEDTES